MGTVLAIVGTATALCICIWL